MSELLWHQHACGGACDCLHPEREQCPGHVEWPEGFAERQRFAREWYGEDAGLCIECEFPFRPPFSHVYCPDDD